VVMDQPIIFHKPNKKVRSEKKTDHFIPQTKHTINVLLDELEFLENPEQNVLDGSLKL
jgi:hypothetical protein